MRPINSDGKMWTQEMKTMSYLFATVAVVVQAHWLQGQLHELTEPRACCTVFS